MSELKAKFSARRGGDQARGFSMLELLVVIAISMVIAGIAIVQAQPALMQIRANTAKDQVQSALRQARETAISDRRDVQVEFLVNPAGNPPGSYVRLTRIGGACCANTVISMVPIQNSVFSRPLTESLIRQMDSAMAARSTLVESWAVLRPGWSIKAMERSSPTEPAYRSMGLCFWA